jgi:hypothetical protein
MAGLTVITSTITKPIKQAICACFVRLNFNPVSQPKQINSIFIMSSNQLALYIRLRNKGLSRTSARGIVSAHPVLINRQHLPAVIYPPVIRAA